jgi:hypothetical protein
VVLESKVKLESDDIVKSAVNSVGVHLPPSCISPPFIYNSVSEMMANDLIFSGGDCHIYLNHVDVVKQQLEQETYKLPTLELSNKSIDDIKYEDFNIIGYQSSPVLKGELSN